MGHARPDYAIFLAILGILLAIGIPSLRRGQFLVAGLCLTAAAILAGWAVVTIYRERR